MRKFISSIAAGLKSSTSTAEAWVSRNVRLIARSIASRLTRFGRIGLAYLGHALAHVRYLARAISFRWRRTSAPSFFVLSFACLILIGTVGLRVLPGLYTGAGLGLLDALFTATSAVCVTGLIVVDTATYFTFWGQVWILLLFQLGGIGLITLTTAIIGAMGRRLSLRSEMTSVTTLERAPGQATWELARRVARFTITVELIAALALFLVWLPQFKAHRAAWHALFQSVSAFCNAGFSTFSDSLEGFNDSPVSLFIMSALIITGGLGFLTIGELDRWWRSGGPGSNRRLSSHSYAVVTATIVLLILGTLGYAALEWNGTLAALSPVDRVTNAWFMSVTSRTAGFNSIQYSSLGNAAGLLTILLMFAGGSPGSTAGGLKTTTLAVLVAWGWSRSRSRKFIGIHGRAVPQSTLENTVSITMLYMLVGTASFFVLSVVQSNGGGATEHYDFLPIAFECISAFSTVGLSMGTTSELAAPGKLVVIVLMFVGRVGLLAFFSAVLLRRRPAAKFHPAQEDLIVG